MAIAIKTFHQNAISNRSIKWSWTSRSPLSKVVPQIHSKLSRLGKARAHACMQFRIRASALDLLDLFVCLFMFDTHTRLHDTSRVQRFVEPPNQKSNQSLISIHFRSPVINRLWSGDQQDEQTIFLGSTPSKSNAQISRCSIECSCKRQWNGQWRIRRHSAAGLWIFVQIVQRWT